MREVTKYPDSIELRHLRYFVAAAEHGSFRKAGTALGRSQAAISRCIADLEDQIGASLFHRHTWGVSATYAGQRFLRRARKAIRTIGEGAYDVASAGRSENGRVRIGIYSSIASGFLADLLRDYSERHGTVRIELIDGNPDEHVAAITAIAPRRRLHHGDEGLAGLRTRGVVVGADLCGAAGSPPPHGSLRARLAGFDG